MSPKRNGLFEFRCVTKADSGSIEEWSINGTVQPDSLDIRWGVAYGNWFDVEGNVLDPKYPFYKEIPYGISWVSRSFVDSVHVANGWTKYNPPK